MAIIVSVFAILGVAIMCMAIFAKKEDVEGSSANASDWFALIAQLVFVLSPLLLKRILLFVFWFLMGGTFLICVYNRAILNVKEVH